MVPGSWIADRITLWVQPHTLPGTEFWLQRADWNVDLLMTSEPVTQLLSSWCESAYAWETRHQPASGTWPRADLVPSLVAYGGSCISDGANIRTFGFSSWEEGLVCFSPSTGFVHKHRSAFPECPEPAVFRVFFGEHLLWLPLPTEAVDGLIWPKGSRKTTTTFQHCCIFVGLQKKSLS